MSTVQVQVPLVDLLERAIAMPGGDEITKEFLQEALSSRPTMDRFGPSLRELAQELLVGSPGGVKGSSNNN